MRSIYGFEKHINLIVMVFRLRDVTSEQEAELQKKLKAAEKELTSLQDIQGNETKVRNCRRYLFLKFYLHSAM